ncbi:MAG: DUF3300 domain-containing protein [Alphaproteobacteria bacterium]|nr:DUF3300 domain-containing protein [Alphaproteobacteria bacterium]
MTIKVVGRSGMRCLTTVALIAAISSLGVTMFSPAGWAQTQAAAANAGSKLSNKQLDDLVGPIALYPDELLAIVLPASTYPLEIVQAARYLEKRKSEPKLKPSESWDSSVLGLLNYPEVVEKMNQDLDITSRLGDAVINQQQDLMDAIQRFRTQAYSAGNLESGEHTTIIREKEIIKIESATPDVIYVPAYNPTVVVVQQPAPYPYVYSSPYPYYHSPAATFWTGMFVGAAIGYGIGWNGHGNNDININRNFSQNVNVNRGSGNKWNPNRRPGGQVGRPGTRPGVGTRPGGRPGVGTRPAGQTRRDSSTLSNRNRRGSVGGGGQVRTQQGRGGQVRRQQGRGGAFGNYQSGRSARNHSSRGQKSRASRSNNRTSKASGGRSGGGRGSGGRGGGGRGGRR